MWLTTTCSYVVPAGSPRNDALKKYSFSLGHLTRLATVCLRVGGGDQSVALLCPSGLPGVIRFVLGALRPQGGGGPGRSEPGSLCLPCDRPGVT